MNKSKRMSVSRKRISKVASRKKSVSRKKKSVSRKKKSVSRKKKSVSRKKKSVSRKKVSKMMMKTISTEQNNKFKIWLKTLSPEELKNYKKQIKKDYAYEDAEDNDLDKDFISAVLLLMYVTDIFDMNTITEKYSLYVYQHPGDYFSVLNVQNYETNEIDYVIKLFKNKK